MKQAGIALILLLSAASASAARHQYVIGVRPSLDRAALARTALRDGDLPERRFRDFARLGAFAADLTDEEAAALSRNPQVRFVEPSMTVYAFEEPAAYGARRAAPLVRDPSVQTLPYGITHVDAPDTWAAVRGDAVNIAIIDTGIDYNHPDLKARYAGGYNVPGKSNDPRDDNGHGTHVAGTIAAEDNSLGVVGVAPHARIWAVKVLDAGGSGTTADIADGFNWVLQKKAEIGGRWIVNMSLGICSDPAGFGCAKTPPEALVTACQRAADAGVLIFAASGNDSAAGDPAPVSYPAAFPSVIAVGAVGSDDKLAEFSNQGPEVALVAPGIDILSTVPVGTAANSFLARGSTLYDAAAITGSKIATVSGDYVFCGYGATAADFPPVGKGNIALIERGNGVSFNQKTKNALQAGAIGVVVYNCSKTTSPGTCSNDSPYTLWTLITKLSDGTDNPDDVNFPWPLVIGVSKETGDALRKAASTAITAANTADDYTSLSGTSMACPHAVGVAALVWSAAPLADSADIKSVMLQNAQHLGTSGRNPEYGFGLVDALATAKSIAPQLFTGQPKDPGAGRKILRRGGRG